MQDSIHTCLRTRNWLSSAVSIVLRADNSISEQQFANALKAQFKNNTNVYPKGWYEPPPNGIATLFSESNNFERLQYDTLRKEQFWPQANHRISKDGIGMIYASPVDKVSGIIGDWGLTVYYGQDRTIRSHIASCLHTIESAIKLAEVGMELRELYSHAQNLFKENALHNARTVTWTDTTGTNLGHTIPWTYEIPTSEEQEIIDSADLNKLKDLISHKRVHINQNEHFKIPVNIAFTFEARLESVSSPTLPNTYFHLIVTFQNSIKHVSANFKDTFTAAGMNSWLSSSYD